MYVCMYVCMYVWRRYGGAEGVACSAVVGLLEWLAYAAKGAYNKREPFHLRASNPITPTIYNNPRAKRTTPLTFHF